MDSIPWEKAKLYEFGKKLSKWEKYEENLFSFKLPSEKFLAIGKNRTACSRKSHAGEDLKNIALRAGLASPNQLRHGSAQASLALLIWLKRWIGKDELLNIINRRFIDEDSLIACNDRLYLLLRDLSACKISYRS